LRRECQTGAGWNVASQDRWKVVASKQRHCGLTVSDTAWRRRGALEHLIDMDARASCTSSIFFPEDSRLINVYAGELEVRPPGAPTTEPHQEAIDRL
jgi:hypothetical protein